MPRSQPISVALRYVLAVLLLAALHMGAAGVAAAAQPPTGDTAPVTVTDGGTYFVGQVLERSAGVSADESLDLYTGGGQLETMVFADGQGVARIDTTMLGAGQYTLKDADSTTIVSFTLVQQQLSIAFKEGSVPNSGPGTGATLEVTSNRQPVIQYITASLNGEAVDASTLHSILGQGTAVDIDADGTDESVRVQTSGSAPLSANLSDVSAGNLTVTGTAPDTGVADAASITVTAQGSGTAALASRVVNGAQGSTIGIPVTLTNTASATLVLGSTAVNYRVTMTAHDGNSDGQVTVRWDTGQAGQTSDAADAFSVASGQDTLSSVTRSTGTLSGTIAAESYPISLRVDGTETDVGTATLTRTTLCDRDPARLFETYNANTDAIPAFVDWAVTDERIHLIVHNATNGNYTVLTGSDKNITAFRQGTPDDPTVEVETDCDTVATLMDATDPADTFKTAYENGDLQIRGTTLLKSVTIAFGNVLFTVGQLLGLL